MSLIQDALKRQQEENEKAGGRGGGQEPESGSSDSAVPSSGEALRAEQTGEESGESAEPAATSDEVQSASGEQRGGRRGVWPVIAGIVLLVILAVGAGIYLITLSVSRLSQEKEPAAAGSEIMPESAQTASAESPSETVVKETQAAAAPAHMEIAEAEPAKPEPASPAAETGAEAKAEPVSPPGAEKASIEPGAAAAAPPPSAAPQLEELPPVKWPRLKLTAVLSGLEAGQNAALINGVMVSEGGEIDGVTLKNVESSGAWLQLEHETRFLRMGASVY